MTIVYVYEWRFLPSNVKSEKISLLKRRNFTKKNDGDRKKKWKARFWPREKGSQQWDGWQIKSLKNIKMKFFSFNRQDEWKCWSGKITLQIKFKDKTRRRKINKRQQIETVSDLKLWRLLFVVNFSTFEKFKPARLLTCWFHNK